MSNLISYNQVNHMLLDAKWFKEGRAIREHKDKAYRLGLFQTWLNQQGDSWFACDLASYRDSLLDKGYATGTIRGHLSTVRARLKKLNDNNLRDMLYASVPDSFSPADRKAFVDEIVARLENTLKPEHAVVKSIVKQDVVDSQQVRLNERQCNDLVHQMNIKLLSGMRDLALVSLMMTTGLREQEAVDLTTDDLRQSMNGELVLLVREGKGKKQRAIPYGDNRFVLQIVDKWLDRAGILSGRVFRGFYKPRKDKQGQSLPPKIRQSLSVRAVQNIITAYPVADDDGNLITVHPHDLRRTYARRQYEMGLDPVKIQQNLGHSDLSTTLGYIGSLDMQSRRGKRMFSYDLREFDAYISVGKDL